MRRLFTLLLMLECVWGGAQIPCNGQFLTVGSATNQGACIQLTPNATTQQGCAWLNTPVDFSQPFTHTMVANFGNLDANGADGICLVYQSSGPGTCGGTGQGIGAQGIPNSFIVEFDTWDNGPPQGDIPQDHCAVDVNGNMASPINGPVAMPNIEDGANHTITFSWNPAGNSYSVTFDGSPVLAGTYDIINLCFGGSNLAYWGYTSSTGAATNTQTICPTLPPQIVVDAGITMDIPCVGTQVMLDGTGSDSGPDFIYSWSALGGHIVSGGSTLTPIVDQPGTYILTLTNIASGCQEMDQVTVTLTPLQAVIAPPPFITCNQPTFFLNGNGSSSGPFISYQWTTLDGMIISGANSTMVEIGSEGTYTLTVTYNNGGNICTEQATVEVMPNPNIPVANALDGMVNCYFPITQLSGVGSSTGASYAYQWTTPNGTVLFGGTTLFPSVGAPGIYTLTVTNINTGCTDEAIAIVDGDVEQPDAFAEVDGMLGCQTPQLTIDAFNSSQGPEFSYAWSTSNGNIISGEASLGPVVDAPGTYILTVTNLVNGCTASASVAVDAGAASLAVDAQTPGSLSCNTTQVILDGTGSGQGPYYEYLWTTANGNIVSGGTTLTPTVDAPGTYTLTVTNLEDGCTGMASVMVAQNIAAPAVEAGNAQVLSCGDASLTLDGNGTAQGAGFTYQWSSANGNIVSGGAGLSPLVNAAGTYFLQVTNAFNGCTAIDSVVVSSDANAPALALLVGDTLDCATGQVSISAAGSSTGANYDYEWMTPNGNFVSTLDSLLVSVDAPGQYSLSITDLSNNCVSTSTVTVAQNITAPIAVVAPADTLDCATVSLVLDGTASSQGPQYTYQWSTTGGNILSGGQSLSPQADAPGLYQLQATNLQNSCTSTATVIVYQDTLAPLVQIETPEALNCIVQQTVLDASGSSHGAPFLFTWMADVPGFQPPADTLAPIIDAPGIYTLQVFNTQNFCSAEASVLATQDTIAPVAEAGPGQVLNCYNPSLQLDGQLSSQGPGLMYEWTGDSGQAITGADGLTPGISQPGAYQLSVVNTVNGCEAADVVAVISDFAAPTVSIATPDTLTCANAAVTTDGSASSQGPNFEYLWTTQGGSILSGALTPQAVASQAGVYLLQVLNTDNGCSVTDSVQVIQDVYVPVAQIESPLPITCNQLTVGLDGSGSSQGAAYSVSWSTPDGHILSGAASLTPQVDAPGTYLLQVTSLANNCEVMASVQVLIDTVAPVAAAGPSLTLNCLAPSLALDGSGSAQDGPYTYLWATADGNILSGASGLAPQIDAPGTYSLLVTNTDNGCAQASSVAVNEDFVAPAIAISMPEVLNCVRESTLLDASDSDSGPTLVFHWATQNGLILSGADTQVSSVGAPGFYTFSAYNQGNGCSDSLEVEVLQDIIPPVAAIAVPERLTCAVQSLQLDAEGSSAGPIFQYLWATPDGSIVSGGNGPTPAIDAPGLYSLAITNQDNGCQDSAAVTVTQDVTAPVVAIGTPEMLTCAVTEVALDAAGSSTGPLFTYLWSTSDGDILSGANGLLAMAGAPGTYTLTVLNQDNGCSDSLAVTALQDTVSPIAVIAAPDLLTCATQELNLDATASSSGAGYLYQWQTNDGILASGASGLSPTVAAPGSYNLSVLDESNGCSATADITVQQDIAPPIALIAIPDTLDCVAGSVVIDGSSSSTGSTIQYGWQSPDGHITIGAGTPQPTADAPGQYILVVLNTANGCADTATATVIQDINTPVAVIEPPALLTCAIQQTALDGTASSSGLTYLYQWASQGGHILSGANTPAPIIDAPGQYTLVVTNTANGCTAAASVTALQDIQPPLAEAGQNFVLPCFENQRQLNGSGSSVGPEFSYQWATTGGSLASGITTLSPSIEAPGVYTLIVTNNANGCQANDAVEVIQDLPAAVANTIQPLCYGDPGAILVESVNGGLPPYLFSVDGGDNFQQGPVFQQLGAGLYEVVVQDINGCEFRLPQEVVQPDSLVVLAAEAEATVLLGDSYQINVLANIADSEIASITWGNRPDLSCDDCLAPIATPGESTDYRVRVRSINGCQDVAWVRIYVDKRPDIFIPNAFSPNGDGANDVFLIFARAGSVEKVRSFYIFNRWGEQVFEVFNFPPNDPHYGWDGNFRGELMNPAVFGYFAEIEFIDGRVELFKGDVQLVR